MFTERPISAKNVKFNTTSCVRRKLAPQSFNISWDRGVDLTVDPYDHEEQWDYVAIKAEGNCDL